MDFYLANLVVLGAGLVGAGYWQHQNNMTKLTLNQKEESNADGDDLEAEANGEDEAEMHQLACKNEVDRFCQFRNGFLVVYGFAIAADWLQGSFMYSLYKNTLQLPEPTIATLFATGFVSGGISATFVGTYADKFGRKRACLAYCAIYAMSCMTMLSSNIGVLYFGRVLGGISTTILFTAFETWMIAEYSRLGFGYSDSALSTIYGTMSILNGFIAVASGVIAQLLVKVSNNEVAPFLASVGCLGASAVLISRSWAENFGTPQVTPIKSLRASFDALPDSKILVAIGSASCFLEGSMYVMVYSWSQAIISAREMASTTGHPPFGYIFANFMCALTLGSFFYAYVTRGGNSIQLSSDSVQLSLAASAVSLLVTVTTTGEAFRFWSFLVFEFCLGIYFPSIGYLKGNLFGNEIRGKVYGLLRVPLNAFVTVSLVTIAPGDASRENRFMVCGGLLLVAVALMARYIN
ncbi:hypothetical protein DCS_06392 [Drechmeria coniospora]|uniref:Molybdate-anion transporter n=1 Tax=Drechmeria coniospora TaxID=98403 RepID=A0A151GBL0_DRECN|nr:hypothetical protein DCS_06392 [Drechmeria coniospora]KYK54434.1 hypothetical protein DCS_06392 [Drechmeria coniospora]ODA77285.1 hypothetical protein RJ55_06912 [Drechmeria coniospora]